MLFLSSSPDANAFSHPFLVDKLSGDPRLHGVKLLHCLCIQLYTLNMAACSPSKTLLDLPRGMGLLHWLSYTAAALGLLHVHMPTLLCLFQTMVSVVSLMSLTSCVTVAVQ